MAADNAEKDMNKHILKAFKSVMKKNHHLDPIKWFTNHPDEVEMTQLPGGYMNYVMRLRFGPEAQKQSVILKYAPPYVRVVGSAYPAPAERVQKEHQCITKFHEICPGSGPISYYFSLEDGLFLMEDLWDHKVLKFAMKDGKVDKVAIQQTARNIGKIHNATHMKNLSEPEFNKQKDMFSNDGMLSLNKKFMYDLAFDKDEPTNVVEPEVRLLADRIRGEQTVLDVRDKFADIYLHKRECLIHGDLHTGSILVKEGSSKMFDNEFSCVGAMSYDLAFILSHLMFSYHYHMLTPENNDDHRRVAYKILDVCRNVVETYLEQFTFPLENKEQFWSDFFSEVAGFAALEMIERTVGCAHSEDVQGWGGAELEILESGLRLLKAHERIHDISTLLNIALMLT